MGASVLTGAGPVAAYHDGRAGHTPNGAVSAAGRHPRLRARDGLGRRSHLDAEPGSTTDDAITGCPTRRLAAHRRRLRRRLLTGFFGVAASFSSCRSAPSGSGLLPPAVATSLVIITQRKEGEMAAAQHSRPVIEERAPERRPLVLALRDGSGVPIKRDSNRTPA